MTGMSSCYAFTAVAGLLIDSINIVFQISPVYPSSLKPRYFNNGTLILMIFANMDLVCIHFSDFTESYEALANTCTQICHLMHIKFSSFGLLRSLTKISVSLQQLGLRYR